MNNRVLIAASCMLPPAVNGPAVLMRRLLQYFPDDSYCVLMSQPESLGMPLDLSMTLDARYYYVPRISRGGRAGDTYLNYISEFALTPWSVKLGLDIIRKQSIGSILLAPNRTGFEIYVYLMHKMARIPLFIYLFDQYYSPNLPGGFRRLMTRAFERTLLISAEKVFVMSEPLQQHYFRRLGIETTLIPHPVDLSEYRDSLSPITPSGSNGPFRIVFTGMVYDAQIDAIVNMVRVVQVLSEVEVKLEIYTPVSAENLKRQGISGSKVEIRYVSPDQIPDVQRDADVLFLPMAFKAPYPDIITTASPSKMSEYLAAGKPILVHAPAYSYVACYAREHGFALIVDEPDLEKLKQAVLRLLFDKSLTENLVTNARRRAQSHDARMLSDKLQDYLGVTRSEP